MKRSKLKLKADAANAFEFYLTTWIDQYDPPTLPESVTAITASRILHKLMSREIGKGDITLKLPLECVQALQWVMLANPVPEQMVYLANVIESIKQQLPAIDVRMASSVMYANTKQ